MISLHLVSYFSHLSNLIVLNQILSDTFNRFIIYVLIKYNFLNNNFFSDFIKSYYYI